MPGPLAAPRRNIHANGARTLLPLGKRRCGVFGLQANTPGVEKHVAAKDTQSTPPGSSSPSMLNRL